MGVIQNNVNQLLTMAAVGARTSKRYENMQELKGVQNERKALESQRLSTKEVLRTTEAENLNEKGELDLGGEQDVAEVEYRKSSADYQEQTERYDELLRQEENLGYKLGNKKVVKNAENAMADRADEDANYQPKKTESMKREEKAKKALEKKQAIQDKIDEQIAAVAAIRDFLQGNQQPQTLLYDASGKPLIRGDK